MTTFVIVLAHVAGIALGAWLGWEVRGAAEDRLRQLEAARRRSAQRSAEGAHINEGDQQ